MIADFHNDVLTNDGRQKIIDGYKKSANEIVCAIFRGKRTFDEVWRIATWFLKVKSDNLHLAFEDVGFELCKIEKLIALQPLYITLTWNGENSLGFGAKMGGGLKKDGFRAIERANRGGVAVDVAHISREGFFDVLDNAEKVVDSHTCFYELCQNLRNITAEQTALIVERGGLVGLALYAPFLTSEQVCTAESVFRHIDFFVEKFGTKNLALGTDFYGADSFPMGMKNYEELEKLSEIMKNHGYKDDDVHRIMFDNLHQYIENGK